MKLLILDFISRRRWFLVIVLGLTAFSAAAGTPFQMAWWAMLFFQRDRVQGWPSAVRYLPVSTRGLALTGWLLSIGLLPLLALAVIPLGVWIRGLVPWGCHWPEPWFGSALSWWLSFGFFAFWDVAWKMAVRLITQLGGRFKPWCVTVANGVP